MGRRRRAIAALLAVTGTATGTASGTASGATPASAQELRLPVLVPLTGFVALEGTSQRNGALLAAGQFADVVPKPEVLDTQATPEAALTAWERAMNRALPPAMPPP